MRVYSPSQTERWLTCPMLRALSKGFEPRVVNGPRDFGAILGDGFAAGIAVYNRWRQTADHSNTPTDVVNQAVEAAVRKVERRLERLDRQERVTSPRDEAQRTALTMRVEKAVKRSIADDPLPLSWKRVEIEEPLGEDGGDARPDLVVNDGRGIAPVDYKTKLSIWGKTAEQRGWNKAAIIEEYSRSWQMFHYCWHLSTKYVEPVVHYYIVLIVLEPKFSIELLPYEVSPEAIEQWSAFAKNAWLHMEAEDLGLEPMTGQMACQTRYGPCDFVKACWECHYDEDRMERDYVLRVP